MSGVQNVVAVYDRAPGQQIGWERMARIHKSSDREDIEEGSHLAAFVLKELHQPAEQLAKKRGFDSNTMGLRFPFWLSACTHTKFTYTLTFPGSRE